MTADPVVYTALLGGSDCLKLAPAGFQAVCFTERQPLDRLGWEIRLVPPPTASPRQTARVLRYAAADLFPGRLTIWADASYDFLDLAAAIADLGDGEFGALRHPDRQTYAAEGTEVVALGQAPADRVTAQVAEYRAAGFVAEALTTTGLLLRRPTPIIAAFDRLLQAEIDRYTVYDQIAIDYCAWRVGLPITYLRGSYRENPYVRYAHKDHRRRRVAGC